MKKSASVLLSLAALYTGAAAEELWVTIDHSRVYQSEQAIGSLVVGNPAVADVTVKSSTEFVLFGVAPGTTNIKLFGADGEELKTLTIAVRNPRSNRLTLQSGQFRYTFACTDVCEQVPVIGDGSNQTRAFNVAVDQQAQSRLAAAQTSANSSSGMPSQPTDPFADNDNSPADQNDAGS